MLATIFWIALIFASTVVVTKIISWFFVYGMTEREEREWYDTYFFYIWGAIVIGVIVMYVVFKLDPGGQILDEYPYG